MTDDPLSVDQARAASGANDDGRARCPVCDPEGIFTEELRLTISPNGNGAHLECSHGCDPTVIAGHLRKALRDLTHTPTAEQRRDAELGNARGLLKCPELDGVIQRGREDPLFDLRFVIDGRQVVADLGPMSHLKDPRKVEDVIAEVTGRMPDYFTVPKFRAVLNHLLAIKEIDDTGSSSRTQTRGWLADFVAHQPLGRHGAFDRHDPDQKTNLAGASIFWSTNDELYVHAPSLGHHLRVFRKVFVDDAVLVGRLRRLDFERDRIEGKRSTRGQHIPKRTFWRSPRGFDLSEET